MERPRAPQASIPVSILTRFFILTISQYAKTALAAANAAGFAAANAIEMKDEHPVWIKETCFMCFGCLRLCPTAAIHYGDIEQSKCAIAKVS